MQRLILLACGVNKISVGIFEVKEFNVSIQFLEVNDDKLVDRVLDVVNVLVVEIVVSQVLNERVLVDIVLEVYVKKGAHIFNFVFY